MREEILALTTDAVGTAREYPAEPVAESLTDQILALIRAEIEKGGLLTQAERDGVYIEWLELDEAWATVHDDMLLQAQLDKILALFEE